MTAGLGRPLILTTLERDEAMRVLDRGRAAPAGASRVIATRRSALIGLTSGSLWTIARGDHVARRCAASPEPSGVRSAAIRAAAARVLAWSGTR